MLGGAVVVSVVADPTDEIRRVEAVLDDFHDAAAKADGERYFRHLAPNGVFLGTDASERWTKREFQAFAEPYFSQGKGWAYAPRDRHAPLRSQSRSISSSVRPLVSGTTLTMNTIDTTLIAA